MKSFFVGQTCLSVHQSIRRTDIPVCPSVDSSSRQGLSITQGQAGTPVLLVNQFGSAVIPLRRIALNVNKLPRIQRAGVRIHSFYIWLLHKIYGQGFDGNNWLGIEHIFLRLGQQLVTSLLIERAIGLIQHVDVFLVPPAAAIVSAGSRKNIQKGKRIHVVSTKNAEGKPLVL